MTFLVLLALKDNAENCAESVVTVRFAVSLELGLFGEGQAQRDLDTLALFRGWSCGLRSVTFTTLANPWDLLQTPNTSAGSGVSPSLLLSPLSPSASGSLSLSRSD